MKPRPPPLSLVEHGLEQRFYCGRAGAPPGPVLVLGCSNGTLAFELCERGFDVVAVDPSEVMVRAAEERRAEEGLDGAHRLRFLCADLRSLRLAERFPVVLAPQNAAGSMGGLEDLEALFASARHHLATGDALVLDLLNAASAAREGGDGTWRRAGFHPHLRERKRGKTPAQGLRRLRVRLFAPDEVDRSLAQLGFSVMERYGSFDGKPFDPQDPVQVLVAAAS